MMIHQLTQRRSKSMTFSSSTPPDVFGNSGVFLQYVHSRLCGIEQQLVKRGLVAPSETSNRPTMKTCGMGKLLHQQEAFDLAEWMTQFSRIMHQARTTMDPSSLVSYLFKLARMTNQSLYGLRIKDVQEDLALARWTLFWAARQTLANGLVALGIEPVYRM
jgi:arginyl-tRNA synthetase